jgi:mRNA-degrading endonuclease RelE of RelBE toxin-antitoxin system
MKIKVLSGEAFASLWRYRVEDYRLVCEGQDAAALMRVVSIGHRSAI